MWALTSGFGCVDEIVDVSEFLIVLFLQIFGKAAGVRDGLGLVFHFAEECRILEIRSIVRRTISADAEREGEFRREASNAKIGELRAQKC